MTRISGFSLLTGAALFASGLAVVATLRAQVALEAAEVEALQSLTDRFLAVQSVAAVLTLVKAVAAEVVLALAPVPSRLALNAGSLPGGYGGGGSSLGSSGSGGAGVGGGKF